MNVRCPYHRVDFDDDHEPRCPMCVRGGFTIVTCDPAEVDAVRATLRGLDDVAAEVGAYAVVIYRGYTLANQLPDPVGGSHSPAAIRAHLEQRRLNAAQAVDWMSDQDRWRKEDDRK